MNYFLLIALILSLLFNIYCIFRHFTHKKELIGLLYATEYEGNVSLYLKLSDDPRQLQHKKEVTVRVVYDSQK